MVQTRFDDRGTLEPLEPRVGVLSTGAGAGATIAGIFPPSRPGMLARLWQRYGGECNIAAASNGSHAPAFSRMLDIGPESLGGVFAALFMPARDVLELGNVSLRAPRHIGSVWQLPGRLRVHRRGVPIHLSVWPHVGYWTKICVEPVGGVRRSRAYYRAGNRALDALTRAMLEAAVCQPA